MLQQFNVDKSFIIVSIAINQGLIYHSKHFKSSTRMIDIEAIKK